MQAKPTERVPSISSCSTLWSSTAIEWRGSQPAAHMHARDHGQVQVCRFCLAWGSAAVLTGYPSSEGQICSVLDAVLLSPIFTQFSHYPGGIKITWWWKRLHIHMEQDNCKRSWPWVFTHLAEDLPKAPSISEGPLLFGPRWVSYYCRAPQLQPSATSRHKASMSLLTNAILSSSGRGALLPGCLHSIAALGELQHVHEHPPQQQRKRLALESGQTTGTRRMNQKTAPDGSGLGEHLPRLWTSPRRRAGQGGSGSRAFGPPGQTAAVKTSKPPTHPAS